MNVKENLELLLSYIAKNINREHIRKAEALQTRMINYEKAARVPVILHINPATDWTFDYQKYPLAEAWQDPYKMLYNELYQPLLGVHFKDDRMLNSRVDFGPATFTTCLGLDYGAGESTTWCKPLHSSEAVRAFIQSGYDFSTGKAAQIEEYEQLYMDYFDQYGLSDCIHMFQASNQGVFDVAEMIWGQEIYCAMYDEPELVHELMDFVTRATIDFVSRQKRVLKETDPEYFYHWWYKVKGQVRLVDDVQTNISPEKYQEFVAPYAGKVFSEFGGGYEHYCGCNHHNLEARMAVPGVNGSELVQDRFEKNRNKLLAIWSVLAKRKQTVYWIANELEEDARQCIRGGLIFGYFDETMRTKDEIAAFHHQVREFWSFK